MKRFAKTVNMLSLVSSVVQALLVNGALAQEFNSVWDASSGDLPESVCPLWYPINTTECAAPALVGDTLVLATCEANDDMFYFQTGATNMIPDTLLIEFAMKHVSQTSGSVARRNAGILIRLGGHVGNFLWIGADEVFLWDNYEVIGDSIDVDTDGSFHVYRLEIVDRSEISVYQDDSPILTGLAFYHPFWQNDTVIIWGNMGADAFGITNWLSFRHNAYAFNQDFDGDGVTDSCDNCPEVVNPGQDDWDDDGIGDACCACPYQCDFDEDGFITAVDLSEIIDVFFGGHPVVRDPQCPTFRADFDNDRFPDVLDLTALIDHLFAGQPGPCDPCNPIQGTCAQR